MGRTSLLWHVQYAVRQPSDNTDLLHVARGNGGAFEIFDDGSNYLLHFPRALKLPAELFTSLEEAKGRAALELVP